MKKEEYLKLIKKPERKHKYGAKPCEHDGIYFPSTLEGNRYLHLKLQEKAGIIRNLKVHTVWDLIAGITYEDDANYTVVGIGKFVVEDSKGMLTPEFKLKAKLFKHVYGFDITIVRK